MSDLASLFSLSECKLFLELDPLRSDGKPKLSTDDFFVPGVAGDDRLESVGGDIVDLTRRRALGFGAGIAGGDADFGPPPGGTCIDCEDERRKKGIDDGVRRLDDPRRRDDDEGLSGSWLGARPPVFWFVLALDAVSGRLGAV